MTILRLSPWRGQLSSALNSALKIPTLDMLHRFQTHITSSLAIAFTCGVLTVSTPLSAAPVQDIAQLKELQTKVQNVAQKVMPTTVSLFSAKSGASGSGVVISKDGLILTAGHVVRGANEMTVTFPNGKQARAKVLGANYTRDSAMVKIIDKGEWAFAEVGKSKQMKSGDYVVALGHAGGYDAVRTPPVRFGRIIKRGKNKFFTSDCTLIGGDSGGPLFDLDGKVVGIHSSIGVDLASNNHASIEGFHQDWDKLLSGKNWGRLGGSILDNPDSPVLGILPETSAKGGVGVRHVFEGTPAQRAGIRAGDVILSIEGKKIDSQRALHVRMTKYKAGQTVTLRIQRGEEKLTRKVKLARRSTLKK